MPVYNGEAYLALAIQSILDQTFTDFELIITDNASTDSTRDICRRFAKEDSRIRFIQNDRNIGGWRNHNKVLGLAQTELFQWAGHDDLRAPEALERCVELLDADSGAVMSFVGVKRIDENGNDIEFIYSIPDFSGPTPSERFREAIRLDYSLELFYSLHRTATIKSTRGLGQFSDSDRVLTAELALAGRFVFSDDVLFFRRNHPDQSTKKYRSRQARTEWINPGGSQLSGAFPFHRELWEFTTAVLRARIPAREKRKSLGHVFAWLRRYDEDLFNDYRRFGRTLIGKMSV